MSKIVASIIALLFVVGSMLMLLSAQVLDQETWNNVWNILGNTVGAIIGGVIAMRIAKTQSASDRTAALEAVFIQQKTENLPELLLKSQSSGGDFRSMQSLLMEVHNNPVRLEGENWTNVHNRLFEINKSGSDSINDIIGISQAYGFYFVDIKYLSTLCNLVFDSVNALDQQLMHENFDDFKLCLNNGIVFSGLLAGELGKIKRAAANEQKRIYESYTKGSL